MKIEKEDKPTVQNADDFDSACKALWDELVRGDMITMKGLLFCRSCICFFKHSDGKHNHPIRQVVLSNQLCEERAVNSLETFILAMKMEAGKVKSWFGKLVVPMVSLHHRQPPKQVASKEQPKPTASTELVQWQESRIRLLEQEVQRLQADMYLSKVAWSHQQSSISSCLNVAEAEKKRLEDLRAMYQRHSEELGQLLYTPSQFELLVLELNRFK